MSINDYFFDNETVCLKISANVYALAIGWAFNEFSAGTKIQ
jgi:hypothetical protein